MIILKMYWYLCVCGVGGGGSTVTCSPDTFLHILPHCASRAHPQKPISFSLWVVWHRSQVIKLPHHHANISGTLWCLDHYSMLVNWNAHIPGLIYVLCTLTVYSYINCHYKGKMYCNAQCTILIKCATQAFQLQRLLCIVLHSFALKNILTYYDIKSRMVVHELVH